MPLNETLKDAYAEAGLTDAQMTALENLDEETQKRLAAGYAKNRDYTVKTQSLAEERKQVELEKKQIEAEKQRLAEWQKGAETQLASAMQKVTNSNLRGAALQSKIEAMAMEYNLDADELLADVKEARKEEKEIVPEYMTRAEGEKAAAQLQQQLGNSAMLPVQIRDLEREYRRLYGKEYDGSMEDLVTTGFKDIVARQQAGENITFKEYVREKLDFAGQAKKLDEDGRKQWEADKEKEIEQRLRSEIGAENPAALSRTRQTEISPYLRKPEGKRELPARNAAEAHQRRTSIYGAFNALQDARNGT